MKISKERQPEDKKYNIPKLLIGLLFVLVGLAEILSKTTYTFYWFIKVEGPEVQLFGGIIALYGVYLSFSAIRQLIRTKKDKSRTMNNA